MRLSELATIYLAIGAPFAVARIAYGRKPASVAKRTFDLFAAITGWPLLCLVWATHRRVATPSVDFSADDTTNDPAERAERLKRRIFTALFDLRDRHLAENGAEDFELALITVRMRESIEQYIGLSFCARNGAPGPAPSAAERELLRLAGRSSADLEGAARCLHRRNAARFRNHINRARTGLLEGLTALNRRQFALTVGRGERPSSSNLNSLNTAAIEIFRLLDDQEAVTAMEIVAATFLKERSCKASL